MKIEIDGGKIQTQAEGDILEISTDTFFLVKSIYDSLMKYKPAAAACYLNNVKLIPQVLGGKEHDSEET